MSSESTPVLSCAIPAFERLVKKWKDLAQCFAHLAPFVAIGLTWTDKYHERMSHTGAYGVAMCQSHAFLLIKADSHVFIQSLILRFVCHG
jgi:hypothetical protein